MNLLELLEKSLLEGYATSDLNINTMFICIGLTAILSVYIYYVYKLVNKNTFYNRTFNLSLIALSIITASVILTIQSNIVVSLGMVGALSIVRFRTAIKDPLDLVFLFWSISVGIICGAGYAMIAIISSIILTIIVILFVLFPQDRSSMMLVVDCKSPELEDKVMSVVNDVCRQSRVRAKTATKKSLNMAIEVKVTSRSKLLSKVLAIDGVETASIVEHDGEITA